MDTLDKLIELAQITGSVDIQCLFRDKWYVPHERRRAHGIAHLVIAGESYIKMKASRSAAAESGRPHLLSAQCRARPQQRSSLQQLRRYTAYQQ